MRLEELFASIGFFEPVVMTPGIEITDIVIDSRLARPGTLFVAIRGAVTDGHRHLEDAATRGAVAAIVSEDVAPGAFPNMVRVPDTSATLAPLARCFFDDPSRVLRLIGITGTNGKSTTCFILRRILEEAGEATAVLGTVGYFIAGERFEAPNTTPNALLLNRLLARCREKGVRSVVMEVSSHALALDRIAGLSFRSGIFTNLTQDHLDFHHDMEDYFAAKARLFELCSGRGAANADDAWGTRLLERYPRLLSFGAKGRVRAERIALSIDETRFSLISPDGATQEIRMKLVGRPNVENALAAAAAALDAGIGLEVIARGLAAALPPAGRFEPVATGAGFAVAVDYAHTPDALERLLTTGRDLAPRRLKVVFGCGGDRDRTKRPLMGAAAAKIADEVWITSDNPRTEDPERILDEIAAGITRPVQPSETVHRIADRRAAIHDAVATLRDGDLLLIAGKGHEDYQIIGREKFPFDDRLVAAEAIQEKKREVAA